MFKRLTIGGRLWLNLLMAVIFLSGVAISGWYAMNQAEHSAQKLVSVEQERTVKVAQFHEDFIKTVQGMNTYLLTLDEEAGKAFNQSLDDQLEELKTLLQSLGAQTEVGGNGYWVLQSYPPELEAMIVPMFSLNQVLINLKKSTNSYAFLKQNIDSTIEYGLTPSGEKLLRALNEMREAIDEDNTETRQALDEIEQKLGVSQILAAKMVSSGDVSYRDEFDKTGLGDVVNPLFENLAESFSMDFSVRETVETIVSSRDDYYESFADLKDYLATTADNNRALSELSEQGNMTLIKLANSLREERVATLQAVEAESRQSTDILVWISLGAIAVMVLFNTVLRSSIVGPMKAMRQAVSDIAVNSQFGSWKPLDGRNELVDMGLSIEQLLKRIGDATSEVSAVSHALASGDLQRQMSADYQGDLLSLSQNFNQSVQRIQSTLQDIVEVSQALEQGRLSHEVDLRQYQGQYGVVMASMHAALRVQHEAIDDVRQVTRAMRDGDFSQRISVNMPGDLSNLKRYLNESLQNLEDAINSKAEALEHFSQGNFSFAMQGEYRGKLDELKTHMSGMAHSVSDMLNEVRQASEHAVHGIKEISDGNQDLNQRVQKQAEVVQRTTARMGEMIMTVNQTVEQAQEVGAATRQVKSDSAEGVTIVQQMVAAMEKIQEASQQVAQITDVIDSISFQTNLLALNAAVEAARAGEAGRGFAVVATEVRALAQKSAQAAKDIKQVTDNNLRSISEGMELSSATQTVFEQNTQSIEGIGEMVGKMNQALDLQTHGIAEVSQALLDIDGATQHNAALVEQISSTSTRIIDQVMGLEDKMQGFNLLAVNDTIAETVLALPDSAEQNDAFLEEHADEFALIETESKTA
ncbi:methyl-accepting chemotaxis protein [Thiomicrorhabdus sp. zzn3]|uniref:methyl-accepting chemotaxis protein n=1 Tax=Thiomicrorhabdus sp. zzn3 TaxID=3039775 RepID=UPI002436C777|nr:methyl-accepting chemotaxis protein [Thiomicrorhabdus sp. zzn3]MDG6778865.1 methyl-accepting chemotaxis protein [Thiomicrorhabdus sp. zzn3]